MVVVWLCWVGYASAATPTLVQHVSSSANPVGVASAGNVFKFALPNAVQAGNCLILGLTYAWSSNRTVSIGDTNGNVWPASAAVTASSGSGTISAVYVLPNAQAGVTTITITLDAPVIPFQYTISEFTNIATVAPVNGTSAAAAQAGAALATGSFTPGNNNANGGNLIWSYYALAQGATSNPSSWVAGPTFSLLDADIAWTTNQGFPHASQFAVQATTGAINPSITAAGDRDVFNGVSVALKAAPAGTAASGGIHIDRILHQSNTIFPASWKIHFPSTGNLLVLTVANGSNTLNITGITDSLGNTWVKKEPASDQPQIWYAANATPSPALLLTLTISGVSAQATIVLYDVSHAAASPFDVVVGKSLTDCSNATSITNAPTITPTTTNGLVIAVVAIGQGPGLSVTSPTGAIFDLVTYAGEVDAELMENADLKGHLYNTTTATENWNWRLTSILSNSYSATAVAFKGSGGGGTAPSAPQRLRILP